MKFAFNGVARRLYSNVLNKLHDYSPLLFVTFFPLYVASRPSSDTYYWFYLIVILTLWYHALQNYFSFSSIEEKTKHLVTRDSRIPPSITNIRFWIKLMNPFWKRRFSLSGRTIQYVKSDSNDQKYAYTESDENLASSPADKASPAVYAVFEGIQYATKEEIFKAGPGSERYTVMDIHVKSKTKKLHPVFIYIRGDHWSRSSRTTVPPLVRYLVEEGWCVVCTGFRPFPYVYPSPVVDIKKCIRWIKKHGGQYGADTSFISVGGSNSYINFLNE